jgi:hypothetical protein
MASATVSSLVQIVIQLNAVDYLVIGTMVEEYKNALKQVSNSNDMIYTEQEIQLPTRMSCGRTPLGFGE